ncbi:hypothetical protein ES288_A13G169100v1 [Gossypium darwinii]|uniref:Uncharacterized protein n=1 Tax=Gossypium darwinii TaxID=34276 RepID=A0A5D2E0Q1_GOSDA|nr:hypothetical protein ES288_A13G169100v1 [Gossypium darwinii]
MICPRGIKMDSATVHEEINSFFESREGKGRRVKELLKRCPNLKKIIIFKVISKANLHKECQVLAKFTSSIIRLMRKYMHVEMQFE